MTSGRRRLHAALGPAVVLVVASIAVLHSCGTRQVAPGAPSVLLITVDTLRPDRLSCYGYDQQKTPAIDSLANEGALFEHAVCDIPWTTGSMASVMTGTYSRDHGLHLPNERLRQGTQTLARILKENGYQTAAVVGSFPVSSIYGLNQGFDLFDEDFSRPFLIPKNQDLKNIHKVPDTDLGDFAKTGKWVNEKMRNDAYRSDDDTSSRALEWLRVRGSTPFFLWVHYFGPHERLYAGSAASQQEPRIVADYDADLQKTDAAVGRLLAGIKTTGLQDRLLVVLHADHGQSLGEHAFVGHGVDVYDASIRVPLIVRFPGHVRAGLRLQGLVRNVDILPTILDLLSLSPGPRTLALWGLDWITVRLGRRPSPPVSGRSLVPAIMGRQASAVPAYSETYTTTVLMWPVTVPELGTVLGPLSRYAIRTDRWKLIEDRWQQPCRKGSGASRGGLGVHFDEWQLLDEIPLPRETCDRLRVRELYDVLADPAETQNVATVHPEVVAELEPLLHAAAGGKSEAENLTLSPADKERLRSLGYHTGDD